MTQIDRMHNTDVRFAITLLIQTCVTVIGSNGYLPTGYGSGPADPVWNKTDSDQDLWVPMKTGSDRKPDYEIFSLLA